MQRTEYYRVLATALPPAELGQAAWRRVRRMAIRRVRELSGGAGRAAGLVGALALSSQDELAVRLRGERAARGPLEPNELAAARSLIARHLPDHARALVERADRILEGELWLFGAWRPHARGELGCHVAAVDWTRDPLQGGPSPRPDPRAVWEAGRLAHVLWLAQAEVVAGMPGTERSRGAHEPGLYARALALQVRDFIATQPVGRGVHWQCPMEAALRAIHLALALLLVRASPEMDALFLVEAAEALWEHGRFIDGELEDGQAVPGNHLLADLAGLSVLGLAFPELPDAMRWRARALPAFGGELLRQTTPEGLAFEASLPYHRFATELGLVVQAFARRQGLSLEAEALGRLWKMARLVEEATLADGRLASLGDNDSSHAFVVEPRASLDGAPVTALAAALGGPGLPSGVEPEALWLGGLSGLRRNVLGASPQLARHLRPAGTFVASGLVVLRGDGGRSATLWAGENGQKGLGGHAHNDKLASEICLGGRRIVVDPGCPVYLGDPAERDRYRSTSAHPTVTVDHLEQGPVPVGRAFLLPEAARARVVEVEVEATRAVGEHRGYARLRPGVRHRREVALPPRLAAVVVTDRLLGEGAHVAEVVWPLALSGGTVREATSAERTLLERLEALPCGEGRFDPSRVVVLPGEDGRPLGLMALAAEVPFDLALFESSWSGGYGERVRGQTVRVTVRAQLPLALSTAFVALGGGP